MSKYLILAYTLCIGIVAGAQDEIKFCGQTEQTQKLFERFHGLQDSAEEAQARLEAETQAYGQNRAGGDEIFIVPVVFHVIHVGGQEDITDEQIYTAMDVINEDFRLLNNDVDDIVDEFQSVAGDSGIEFRLAQLNPNGNCTKGITRTFNALTYEGNDDMKELIQWPRNKYLNIWVCADAAGAAGYSFLPGSVAGWQGADEDGIVIRHDYTGRIGTSTVARSRTLPHEIGHWLNLYHTWGPGNNANQPDNCDIDDYVSDTPLTTGWSSCNLSAESCGSLDNVQNYMDYAGCRRMFTEGQGDRMRAALQSSTAQRNQLWTESNLVSTGVWNDEQILCEAIFEVDKRVVCIGEEIQFIDLSYHGVSEWMWDFGNGVVLEGDDPEVYENPIYMYEEPGTYTVMLTIGNGIDETSVELESFITVLPPGYLTPPLVEGFEDEFPSDSWFLENFASDEAWQVTNTASYSGANSIKLLNNTNDIIPNYDEFYTATFDVTDSEAIWISYKWAHVNRFPATDDRLRVSISPDCGESWYLKKIHRGLTDLPTANASNVSWTPSSQDDWTGNTIIVDIESQLTETFMVKFEFEAHGGNNIYVDDINISGSNPNSIIEVNAGDMSMQIWPNPVGDNGTIRFSTNQAQDLSISITDVVGREILTLHNGLVQAGESFYTFNRNSLSSGAYFVVAQSGGQKIVKKVVVR